MTETAKIELSNEEDTFESIAIAFGAPMVSEKFRAEVGQILENSEKYHGIFTLSDEPDSTDKLIPDYWIISGQVFKNKEDFVKQQMGFNPNDIMENWENSFDHFAIPVYRDPIFVNEYENGVKASFVRQNKVLQEQLNTAKKALTEIVFFSQGCYPPEYFASIAQKALAAIGGESESLDNKQPLGR